MNTSPEYLLCNLLAVIHRDGGHYVAEHGIQKAAEDAEAIVIALRGEGQPGALDRCIHCGVREDATTAEALCAGHPWAKEAAMTHVFPVAKVFRG